MKNVLKSILFLVILVVQVVVISYLLAPKYNMDRYHIIDIASYDILGEKKDSIDVIMIGDSLVYSSISPMEIWEEYGYTSYDCAKAAQLPREAYEQLKIAVSTQHPKIVILEADMLFREEKNKPWYHDIQIFANKFLFFKKFHNNWKDYLFPFLGDNIHYAKDDVYKGFRYITTIEPGYNVDYMNSRKKIREVNAQNQESFEKIWKLCEDNHIKLVLMSMPNMKTWSWGKHDGIMKAIEGKNLEFIDLNIDNPLNIDWTLESRDGGRHLNYDGALKVSHYIGQYLKKTGLLTDHREDKNYKSWWDSYHYYVENL